MAKLAKSKKKKFVPREKKTLVPAPNWDKLSQAKTEEEKIAAFKVCEEFVHHEVSDKEYLHWMKAWIRKESGWGLEEEVNILPTVYLLSTAKHGWKAIKLGFMPESYKKSLSVILIPLLERATYLREKEGDEPSVHPTVSNLDSDHAWSLPTVKSWLDHWQEFLKSNKNYAESDDVDLRRQYRDATTYVSNLQMYIRSGVWSDSRSGMKRENKVFTICKAMAYDKDGVAKRNFGTWYPDIGQIWTKELAE